MDELGVTIKAKQMNDMINLSIYDRRDDHLGMINNQLIGLVYDMIGLNQYFHLNSMMVFGFYLSFGCCFLSQHAMVSCAKYDELQSFPKDVIELDKI